MTRPSSDAVLMEMAYVMSLRGTCSRARVGAVIALDGRVCATGFNGAARGLPHCDHAADDVSADRPIDAPPCRTSVHAEANALVFAARHGVAVGDATLYTTMAPCVPCALLVVNSGVSHVLYGQPYRDMAGVQLLEDAGVQVCSITDLRLETLVVARWSPGTPS